jgi:hypothetical protein
MTVNDGREIPAGTPFKMPSTLDLKTLEDSIRWFTRTLPAGVDVHDIPNADRAVRSVPKAIMIAIFNFDPFAIELQWKSLRDSVSRARGTYYDISGLYLFAVLGELSKLAKKVE